MALPVNIEDLLNKRKIESNRIEFKKGWNPTDIYRTIGAFANDFDNLGGGYILVGVEEERGVAKRPVTGIQLEAIDGILKQMVGFNNLIDPYYLPRTSVEEADGRHILVIWVPSGVNRPYAVPSDVLAKVKKYCYYIRSGTSSIVAKGEVLDELREMANRVPFDERPNPNIRSADISMALLRDYLARSESRLEPLLFIQPLEQTLEQMDLMSGPTENRMIKNVAAMMFCDSPEKFFKYTQVDIVIFPKGRVKDPNNFSETTIRGSVPQMIQGTLTYLKNSVIREYVRKQKDVPESIRFFNYPLQALEEAIVNALYHRDYQQYEPVEISVEPEGIYILNFPGPDRTIPKSDIEAGDKMISRRYRNRRLGDFLKELDLTEGRSTGIPTIQDELVKNGSPRATIETNEERSYINLFIPVHEGCCDGVVLNDTKGDTISYIKDVTKELTERQKLIVELIYKNASVSIPEMSLKIGVTTRTIKRDISQLIDNNILKREGGRKDGQWILMENVTKDVTKELAEQQKLICDSTLNNVTKDVTKDVVKELTERQKLIIDLIYKDATVSIPEMSLKIGVASRTVMRDINSLVEMGALKREGGKKEGRWVLLKNVKE